MSSTASAALKILLVGEQNPYGHDPDFALYPAPDGSAGERLCRVVLGMARRAYLEEFDRCNLLRRGGNWSAPEARSEAAAILASGRERIVALGARVARAFSEASGASEWVGTARPFSVLTVDKRVRVVVLPHPSGRCRAWNDAGSAEKARLLVGELRASAGVTR